MSKALRYNEDKPKLSYILEFPHAIEALARIMELGAEKYGDGNWKLGGKPDKEYMDSMMRHLRSFVEGEMYDKDSGCSHVGHAAWNLLALIELNHSNELYNKEIFNERIKYWRENARTTQS